MQEPGLRDYITVETVWDVDTVANEDDRVIFDTFKTTKANSSSTPSVSLVSGILDANRSIPMLNGDLFLRKRRNGERIIARNRR